MAEEWQAAYSRAELEETRWSQRTLCGRDWIIMEPGDGPDLIPESSRVYAPSCRSCVRLVSSRLEAAPPDDPIPLIANLVLQEVLGYGQSQVEGVPGDQGEALRSATRSELRRRTLRGRTYLRSETVIVVSDDAYGALSDERKDEIQQQLINALESLYDSPGFQQRRPSGISWDAWRVP